MLRLLSTTEIKLNKITPQQAWNVLQQADCIYTKDEVETALDRMAVEITQRLSSTDPLLVCIMTGGVVPFGRLLPRLQFPLSIDFVHATRYDQELYGGKLSWRTGPSQNSKDRTVLLVDDILDEGTTLAGIEEHYRSENAREILKAVLVVKDRPRTQDVPVEFVGLSVPNRYVFGYGMDYKGYLRNAEGIFAERDED